MKRRLKYSLLAIFLGFVFTVIFMVTTNWGLSIALSVVSAVMPGELIVKDSSGNLLSPISLKQIEYRQQGVVVSIAQLDLDWQISALLTGDLRIHHLAVKSIDIAIEEGESAAEPKTVSATGAPILPVNIVIEQANLNDIKLRIGKDGIPIMIEQLDLAASIEHQNINLKHLLVRADEMQLNARGNVSLHENFPLKLTTDYTYKRTTSQHLTSEGVIEGNLDKLHIVQQLSGLVEAIRATRQDRWGP